MIRQINPVSPLHKTAGRDRTAFLMVAPVLLFAVFGALVWVFLANGVTTTGQLGVFATFFAIGPALTVAGFVGISKLCVRIRGITPPGLWQYVLPLGGVAVPLGAFIWSLHGIGIALYYDQSPPLSLHRFLAGVDIGVVFMVVGLMYQAKLNYWAAGHVGLTNTIRFGVFGLAALTAISLFDVNLVSDSLSYDPYVGPASIVLHGGLPLRDAFSQYGLNFLTFVLALQVLPYSLFTAAAVVSMINVLYYLAFLGVAAKLARNKTLITLAAIWVMFFLSSTYMYNVTRTPSVLGMRFLPALLLVLALCYLRPELNFSFASVSCLVLGSLWSLESLLFGAAVYSAYLLIWGAWLRIPWRRHIRNFVVLGTCLATPQLALMLTYWTAWRTLPQYGAYLELVRGATSDPTAAWTMVVDPTLRTWALFGLGYGLGLSYAMYRARQATGAEQREAAKTSVLAAICMLGVGELVYYVGRSATPLLAFTAWPLGLVALWALDHSVGDGFRRRGTSAATFVAVAVIVLPLMMGVFIDRFFQPFNPASDENLTLQPNSTLLGSALEAGLGATAIPTQLWGRINDTQPFPSHGSTPSLPYLQAEVAFKLLQRWRALDTEPLVVMPEAATVFFYAHSTDRLGIAHAPVDGLSPALSARALKTSDRVASGSVILVGNPAAWTQEVPLDDAILARLHQRCTFTELGESAYDRPGLDSVSSKATTVTAYVLHC